MLDAFAPSDDVGWMPQAVAYLREHLADPDAGLGVFVVERPGAIEDGTAGGGSGRRLAACAAGTVEHRLAGPGNPQGLMGHVFNVSTDGDMRRRGYARACVMALLDWYRERGVHKIDLHATPDGEPLYASLGFVRNPDPAMRLRM
jgi:GNAT superfamily N-acetyltransferase